MQVQLRRSARRLSPGVAVSVLMGGSRGEAPPRSAWPDVPGFELTGWLGEGASGKVFVAKRSGTGELGRRVALKVGPLTDRARFEREVSLMEQLNSPYLLSSYAHGVMEGFVPLYWIEMPLMGGQTLAELSRGALEDTLKLCLGVWKGLEALHKAQVAHRDLKPSNVLLTSDGQPKLGDFGLSKSMGSADASVTETGMAFGSPAYMAPEAIQGSRVGLSADVWSFGVMVCELLGGKLPFKGEVAGVVWASVLRDEPDVSGVPEWLRGVIKACLSKEVSARPADAMALKALFVEPVEGYLRRQEEQRRVEAEREARIAELRAQLMSDEAAQARARVQFLSTVQHLTPQQLVAEWERFDAEFRRALSEAVEEQKQFRLELARFEAQVTGATLPDGLVAIEHLSVPFEKVVHEPFVEEVPEVVNERGFLGFGSTQRTVTKRIHRTRERTIKEERLFKAEVYSIEGVEFKLIRLPEKNIAMAQTQVTQALWEKVMGSNPSNYKGPKRPVEMVSWIDCVDFLNALSRKVGLTPAYEGTGNDARLVAGANGFRFPLEAEWEWAARGGEAFEYAGSNDLKQVGWFGAYNNSGNVPKGSGTRDVALLKPNAYGLYDMSGNVWEWCADDYEKPGQHRPGAAERVGRGGSWYYDAGACCVACRGWITPDYRSVFLGLRLSRSLD